MLQERRVFGAIDANKDKAVDADEFFTAFTLIELLPDDPDTHSDAGDAASGGVLGAIVDASADVYVEVSGCAKVSHHCSTPLLEVWFG